MEKEAVVFEFNNYDKRYSFKQVEDNDQKVVLAQKEGTLILSLVYDKKNKSIVDLTGSLGEAIKKNVEKEHQLHRVEDYIKHAYEEYHPDSKKNIEALPRNKF